ncbi:capsular exopolysaccharide family [Rubritalea squalenifaciens DSM 18772]|uniref:Capsular exopolysaccharide family n=2 Tax=Rubritalea TaxID=361050 RepID=A0A1M6RLZ4_9BACT|nr:polysaccharide biosynthesis tyrosine autokinase [Rubritalea squalenifaciens]SHK33449.1 capsular exopolysaccharide family [Rubritalea squalenifaciens DSM 18772]
MQQNNSLNPSEASLHAVDYWQIVKNRYGIILLTFILVVVTAAVITYVMPKKYESVAQIEIKPLGIKTDTVLGQDTSGRLMTRQFFATQFQLIESEENLKRAAIRCQLPERWNLPMQEVVSIMTKSLNTNQERGTDLVEIAFVHSNREDVKMITQAIADSYREMRIEDEEKRRTEASYELEKKIQAQEDLVADHRNRLATMSQKTGIPYAGDKNSIGAGSNPAELNFRENERLYQEALRDRDSLKSIVQRLGDLDNEALISAMAGLNLPEIKVVQNLNEMYLDASRERGSLIAAGLGANHPRVKMSRTRVEALRKQLDEKVTEVRDVLKDKLDLENQRVQRLSKSKDSAKGERLATAYDYTLFNALVQEYEQARAVLSQIKINLTNELLKDNLMVDPIRFSKVPSEPAADEYVSPNWTLNMALGAVAGLVFGVGIAFALELMDTSVKTLEDVERFLQVPVLAVIPRDVGVLHKQSGASPDAEAYRILRTNIEFNRKNPDDNSITVVSGGAGEGKSTTLVNLAYICAQGGYSTLMIDADLRRPKLHTFFDINNTVGLTNYLTTDLMLEDVILQTPIDNLFFMPSGILPADAAGILNSRRMSDLVQDVKQRFDLVLIDSPPILGVSDASVLASEVDLTMIVVQHRKLPRKMLVRVKQAVENVGGTVLGVVLNNVDVKSDSQYQYYTSYYTYYAPSEAPQEVRAAAQPQGAQSNSADLY